MKKQLVRAAAATVLGLSLTTGLAAADINTTGPNSSNNVSSNTAVITTVKNQNDVKAQNNNAQVAWTGSAGAYDNTTAGGATSGPASNGNTVSTTAVVSNDASDAVVPSVVNTGDASSDISNTGPKSNNSIDNNTTVVTTVTNDNQVSLSNNNLQVASSGKATVAGNTTGGSATSGAASNSTSSTEDVDVSN